MRWHSWLVLTLLIGAPRAAVFAQDPPGRVVRLSVLEGDVSFRPDADSLWSAAARNYPLTSGDHLWTDRGARAEVQFGSSALHLGPFTALSADAIDDGTTRLRLAEGTLEVRIRSLDDRVTYAVETPNGRIDFMAPGAYRLDVDSSGTLTTLTVRQGEASIVAGRSRVTARDRSAYVVTGQDDPRVDDVAPLPPDAFEQWAMERDRAFDAANATRYVSAGMVGAADLDGYGRWDDDPRYGRVWYPIVDAGWAPYRYGHWAWVRPWGWTWIDDAPWGFAPFHYGRWCQLGGRWAWTPGVVVARPVYAPALVAFVGGPRLSIGISVGGGGGGAVGWFPLAPNEVYVPAYSRNPTYIRQVNVTNVTNINTVNITNINVERQNYANRGVPGAVTAVPERSFGSGQSLRREAVPVSPAQVRDAAVLGHGNPVSPQVEARRTLATRQPPPEVANRAFGGGPRRPAPSPAPAMAPSAQVPGRVERDVPDRRDVVTSPSARPGDATTPSPLSPRAPPADRPRPRADAAPPFVTSAPPAAELPSRARPPEPRNDRGRRPEAAPAAAPPRTTDRPEARRRPDAPPPADRGRPPEPRPRQERPREDRPREERPREEPHDRPARPEHDRRGERG